MSKMDHLNAIEEYENHRPAIHNLISAIKENDLV